ncbi:MAG: multidrug ABC transporter substrate-binding protein [Candidatus Komeilibacteria bacterium CG_4_10_14_0_2_um_filter_37_10]|uniref:Multidrug ABC transporter substrate-binding protein n=1 Tax=Candidatus Komeilibacteria bacterium CG_4_10_14_0_2_um_filter_37_10 TaxID=1974470 RepID=A0A2M7VFT5_9BACT|nr:MAG: multidrug ABC transporter substrate-binding protein [Candidatus Komeilibacteria bacterium CG_4_10_14_0_2_um_filter_37_10]
MLFTDLIEETSFALLANKARSSLTILGIVIGIGSVIAMISIGQGAQQSIQANIQSLGSNLIMVTPGFQRGVGNTVSAGRGSAQTLVRADADAITQNILNIKAIAPELSGRYQITAKGKNTNTSVIGTVADYMTVRNIEIDLGSFISIAQEKSRAKVVVLGPTVRDDIFGAGVDPLSQKIKIKNIEFTVIGVTKSKGGSGFSNQDDMTFVPLSTAQQFLAGSDRVSSISIQATGQQMMSDLQQQVTILLLMRHKIVDPQLADFTVMNQADIISAASSITDTFTLLLGSVAAISLLVGGIGIMNMMLTTVTERTREIGLRKALGAKRAEINTQFLTESIVLTFIGGLLGVILGWLIALGITKFGGIVTTISPKSVMLSFGVAAVIGVVFGYYPAQRAAKLNPIEALRYE